MKRVVRLLLFLLLLFFACQPTPEQEYVVSHTGPQARPTANAEGDAQPEAEVYPTHWEETADIGTLRLIFEADVRTDPNPVHPLLRVERGTFDGESTKTFFEAAFGTGEWRTNELSRKDLLHEIEEIRLGNVEGYDYAAQQFISTPFENEEELLAPYIQQLQEAPTEDTFVPLSAEYLSPARVKGVVRTSDDSIVYIRKIDVEGERSIVCHKYYSGFIQSETWVQQGDAILDERPHSLDRVSITEEEAIAAADAFIRNLGRDDLRLAYMEKARMLKEMTSHTDDEILEGYYLHYAQATTGCVSNGYFLQNAEQFLEFDDSIEQYSLGWRQELIHIFVTEEGILSVDWENPMEIVGIDIPDVALLPFEEAQGRIKALLTYGVKGSRKLCAGTGDLHVEEVMLSAILRPVKDDAAHALLTPAWIVRFTTDGSRAEHMEPYFLVIDATDGSLIR